MAKEEIRLDKELVKVEEKKQVNYQYKKVKLQHHTTDGKTDHVFLAVTSSPYSDKTEIKYTEEEARTLLNILQTVFDEKDN